MVLEVDFSMKAEEFSSLSCACCSPSPQALQGKVEKLKKAQPSAGAARELQVGQGWGERGRSGVGEAGEGMGGGRGFIVGRDACKRGTGTAGELQVGMDTAG